MKKHIKYVLIVATLVLSSQAEGFTPKSKTDTYLDLLHKKAEQIGSSTSKALKVFTAQIEKAKDELAHSGSEFFKSFCTDAQHHLDGIKDECAQHIEDQIKSNVPWIKQAYYGSNKEIFKGVCAKLPLILQTTFSKNKEQVEKLAGDIGKAVTKSLGSKTTASQFSAAEIKSNRQLIDKLFNSDDGKKIRQKLTTDLTSLYTYISDFQVIKENQDLFSTKNKNIVETKVIPDLFDSFAAHCSKQEIEVFFNFIKCFVEHNII
ncbi:MAG: hypothetical protein H6679_05440 [Epsilonproteobacteria bacterium]|nr:hypothetical protein [Campylobacterota bacterium]